MTVWLDGIVRIWNSRTRSLSKMKDITAPGMCIAYNSSAQILAVGLRSSPSNEANGKVPSFLVLDADNLSIKHYGECKHFSFLDCKYSKDGNLLAFSSEDKSIYIYCAKKYSLLSRAKGHSEADGRGSWFGWILDRIGVLDIFVVVVLYHDHIIVMSVEDGR